MRLRALAPAFLLAALVSWAAPARAATVYTNAVSSDDSGDSNYAIRLRFTPGSNSAGGTLSVTFFSAAAAWTASNVYACVINSGASGGTAYNCNAAPVLLCPTLSVSGGGTTTCTTSGAFTPFTTGNNIVVCAEITSATGPGRASGSASVGTANATAYNSPASSSHCSTQTPGVSDATTGQFYLVGKVVSNAAAGGGGAVSAPLGPAPGFSGGLGAPGLASLASASGGSLPAAPTYASGPTATPGTTTAVVASVTSTPTTAVVSYGLTTAYGSTQSDLVSRTSHSITLASLAGGTYHWKECATDAYGQSVCSADANFTVAGGGGATLTGITLSNSSFTCGTPGTIGAVTVQGTGSISGATLSLTGTDAAQFSLSSSNLTVGSAPAGCPRSYSISIVATLAGATGSPFTQGETITGSNPTVSNTNCAYAGTASTDGCSGAPAAGLSGASVLHPDFFTSYAPQNGQSYFEPSYSGSISSSGVLTISGCAGSNCVKSPLIKETIVCTNGAGAVAACSGSGAVPAGVFISSLGTGATGNGTYNLANWPAGTTAAGTMQSLMRPPWNVAGVEYVVGVPSTVTLRDPGAAVNGAIGGMGTCPNPIAGDHVCKDAGGLPVAYPTGVNPIVTGWDFTLEGGWMVATTLKYDIAGTSGVGASGFVAPTGTVTIQGSKFSQAGANFQPGGSLNAHCGATNMGQVPTGCGILLENYNYGGTNAAPVQWAFNNNYYDAGGNVGASTVMMIGEVCGGLGGNPPIGYYAGLSATPPTFSYNAMIDVNFRCNLAWGSTWYNNYVQCSNYNTTAHGEITAMSVGNTSNTQTIPLAALNYNTILQPSYCAGGNTTIFWFSNGGASANWSDIEINNNTAVTNGAAVAITANTSPNSTTCTGTPADGSPSGGPCLITVNQLNAWGSLMQPQQGVEFGGNPTAVGGNLISPSHITNGDIVQSGGSSYLNVHSMGAGPNLEPGDLLGGIPGYTPSVWEAPTPTFTDSPSPIPHGISLVSPFGGAGCPGATACTGNGGTGTYALTGTGVSAISFTGYQLLAYLAGVPGQQTFRWAHNSSSTQGGIPAAPTTAYLITLPDGAPWGGGGTASYNTTTLYNCNNNFFDPLATGNPTGLTAAVMCGPSGGTVTTFNHNNNINMLNGSIY